MEDQELLDTVPDYVSFNVLMKAMPSSERGKRIIYVEASKESKDQHGEIVLAKALKDSVEVFKKFGVLDLDHKSMPSIAKAYGIANPSDWIIGQPLDVIFNGNTTIVKAQLREGDTPLAEKANRVWEGLTKLSPPDRYYASVGGSVTGKEVRFDPLTKSKVPVITGTHWNNLALSLTPVHGDLNPAGTTPLGVFTKSLNGFVIKALQAGYATDSVGMTGGQALTTQSLDSGNYINYQNFRNQLAVQMRAGNLVHNPNAKDIVKFCIEKFGLSLSDATEYVELFYSELKTGLKHKRSKP